MGCCNEPRACRVTSSLHIQCLICLQYDEIRNIEMSALIEQLDSVAYSRELHPALILLEAGRAGRSTRSPKDMCPSWLN